MIYNECNNIQWKIPDCHVFWKLFSSNRQKNDVIRCLPVQDSRCAIWNTYSNCVVKWMTTLIKPYLQCYVELAEFEWRWIFFKNFWLHALSVKLKHSFAQGNVTYCPDSTKSKYNFGIVVFEGSDAVRNEEIKYRIPIFSLSSSSQKFCNLNL